MPNYNLGRAFGSTCDSLSPVLEVMVAKNSIRVLPNPSDGTCFFSLIDASDRINQIRIMNVLGSEVYFMRGDIKSVDLGCVEPGIYFAEIITRKNVKAILRMIRQ